MWWVETFFMLKVLGLGVLVAMVALIILNERPWRK
jgi:hypothetical protein